MIEAVIFDMDGLLIDTEHHWQATERELFSGLGINITEEMQVDTLGLRCDEQISYWYKRQPWNNPSVEEVEELYNSMMIDYFRNGAELMAGAQMALDFFASRDFPIALASSSNMELITLFLERFKFHSYFQVVYSAEYEEFGKPHPAVYLETARRLNINPLNCLALEDSFNGIMAAKAAGMLTIAVPERIDDRYAISDIVIHSLEELNDEVIAYLNLKASK